VSEDSPPYGADVRRVPESPDFDQIARRLADMPDADDQVEAIAEQLCLVWNARGAADLAKVDAELSMMMGATMAGPYVKNLDRALRKLDRPSV